MAIYNCAKFCIASCLYSWAIYHCHLQVIFYHIFFPAAFRVTGEVKQNATNTVVCKVQGEWNSILEFTYSNGETKCMDLSKLSVTRKRVRPIEKQGPFESRWEKLFSKLSLKMEYNFRHLQYVAQTIWFPSFSTEDHYLTFQHLYMCFVCLLQQANYGLQGASSSEYIWF